MARKAGGRSVQKGLEQILRGIYLGIRNPRSHEQLRDSKQEADAIIVFVDYLLRLLQASRESFTPNGFLERVTDPDFVETERYAELLIAEIPPLRLGDAMTVLYENRTTIQLGKAKLLIQKLLASLSEAQLSTYLATVTEQLRIARQDVEIRTTLQMLTPDIWPQIGEVARHRIEAKLVNGLMKGKLSKSGQVSETLATWSSSFLKAFGRREDIENVLIAKLDWGDDEECAYVARFFLRVLPENLTSERKIDQCVSAISERILKGDLSMRDKLIKAIETYPAEWQTKLAAALAELTDPKNPAILLKDGSPFLSSPTLDDDIPF